MSYTICFFNLRERHGGRGGIVVSKLANRIVHVREGHLLVVVDSLQFSDKCNI